MVNIICPSRYKINRNQIKEKLGLFLKQSGHQEETLLNIIFVGKNKIRSLSKKYKKEDVAHPVLAFSYHEKNNDEKFLGEIVLCYPQAILLAAERQKRVDDIIWQLIKHGINNLLSDLTR